ncbi:hypothetical protein BDR03DRAFT_1062649 [Suillus americanus]|nr:hypothetical protein BDR03DRAFT_1062649 [Suillus americanus]
MVSAPPLSALLTAIVIKNIDEVVYLVSIKNLRVELNDGRFRYDYFLMHFMYICKERPPTLPALDVLGIEPIDQISCLCAPFDLFETKKCNNIKLYVRRVFIMDDCKDPIPSTSTSSRVSSTSRTCISTSRMKFCNRARFSWSSDKLTEFLCFFSTGSLEEQTSLKNYIACMPKIQKSIYYLTGESLATVRRALLEPRHSHLSAQEQIIYKAT